MRNMDFSIVSVFLFGTISLMSDVIDGGSVQLQLSPLHPTVTEHTSLLLMCQYIGDGLVTRFAWYRSDYTDLKNPVASIRADTCESVLHMDMNKCEFSCENNYSTVLEIRDVTRELHGMKFECKAVVDKDVVLYSNPTRPTVNIPVSNVTITKPLRNHILVTQDNRSHEFRCETSGEFPSGYISWYKDPDTPYDPSDDTLITAAVVVENASVYPRSTASVLTYITTHQDDTVSIYCTASNLQDQEPVVSRQRIRFEFEEMKETDVWRILKCALGTMCVSLAVFYVCLTARLYKACKNKHKAEKNKVNETIMTEDISDAGIVDSNGVAYASSSLVNQHCTTEIEHSGQYPTLTRSTNSTVAHDTVNIELYENLPTHILSLN